MSDVINEEVVEESTFEDYFTTLPRVRVRDEDSIWQFKYVPAKFNTCYHSSECTYKRIEMPEGWVKEESIIDDYDYTPAELADRP